MENSHKHFIANIQYALQPYSYRNGISTRPSSVRSIVGFWRGKRCVANIWFERKLGVSNDSLSPISPHMK